MRRDPSPTKESKKYREVGTSLYRYALKGAYFAMWKEHGKLRKKKLKSRALRNAPIQGNRLKEKYQKLKPEAREVSLIAAARYQATLGILHKLWHVRYRSTSATRPAIRSIFFASCKPFIFSVIDFTVIVGTKRVSNAGIWSVEDFSGAHGVTSPLIEDKLAKGEGH